MIRTDVYFLKGCVKGLTLPVDRSLIIFILSENKKLIALSPGGESERDEVEGGQGGEQGGGGDPRRGEEQVALPHKKYI